MVIRAFLSALADIFSKPFRKVLWKSLALTLLLFALVFLGVQLALSYVEIPRFDWLEPVLAILAGLGLLAALIVLTPAVTALFAGLFLEEIAGLVETTRYPNDPPGRSLPAISSLASALRFALVVLSVNLLTLPFLLIGLGALAMLLANAYLLSREFFEMIAMRHHSPDETRQLRQRHARRIFLAGLIPAGLMFVPFANLLVPLFSTAYFTHLFKSITRGWVPASSADTGRDR